jgi:hypothetical protein
MEEFLFIDPNGEAIALALIGIGQSLLFWYL